MNTNVLELKKRIDVIIGKSNKLADKFKSVKGFSAISDFVKNIGDVKALITEIVLVVEVATDDITKDIEDMKSEDKLKAAVSYLDNLIKLPWYLELVDGPILEILISWAVYELNEKVGKNWDLDNIRNAVKEGKNFIEGLSI